MRNLFKFRKEFAKIYRVSTDGPYQTIQAAINAAVADGHTSNDNPAFVEIYPGTYTENLALSPGVHLIGEGTKTTNIPAATGIGSEVIVIGNMTYANSNALTRTQNRLILRGITFTVLNGIVFVMSGTAAVQVNTYECVFQKQTGGDVNPTFQFTNSQATSQCRFNDTIHDMNVAATTILDLQRGTTDFRGRLSGVISSAGVTVTNIASLANAAVLNLANEQGFGPIAATQFFALTSAAAVMNVDRANLQNSLVGGIICNFTANANVRIRQSAVFMQDATSKIASGATGNLTLVNNSYGLNLTTFADAGVNVVMATGRAQTDRTTRSLFVGAGGGNYTTIQAAITAAAAINTAIGGRSRIYIEPGTYIENLAFADNVDLIANVQAASNNGFGLPVNIRGHHTWAAVAANALVQIRGIGFNVQVDQGVNPFFAFSGAAVRPQLVFLECNIFYNFANARNLFTVTTSNNGILCLTRCSGSHGTDQLAQTVFDFSGASGSPQLEINGILNAVEGGYSHGGNSTTFSNTTFIKTGPGLLARISHSVLGCLGDNYLVINDADASINYDNCKIECFAESPAGNWAKYNAAGNVNINNCYLLWNGNLIAQDGGVQSNGNYTFVNNPAPADFITINGQVITFGTDVAIGGTKEATAQNLKTFIDQSATPLLANFIYATYVLASAVVGIVAKDTGTAGDAITITSSVPADVTASGATLTGGADGAGGTIQYGGSSFPTNSSVQSSLTNVQNTAALTSI
jgi:hypothetical protein